VVHSSQDVVFSEHKALASADATKAKSANMRGSIGTDEKSSPKIKFCNFREAPSW